MTFIQCVAQLNDFIGIPGILLSLEYLHPIRSL